MDVQCMHLYKCVGHTWLVLLYMENSAVLSMHACMHAL